MLIEFQVTKLRIFKTPSEVQIYQNSRYHLSVWTCKTECLGNNDVVFPSRTCLLMLYATSKCWKQCWRTTFLLMFCWQLLGLVTTLQCPHNSPSFLMILCMFQLSQYGSWHGNGMHMLINACHEKQHLVSIFFFFYLDGNYKTHTCKASLQSLRCYLRYGRRDGGQTRNVAVSWTLQQSNTVIQLVSAVKVVAGRRHLLLTGSKERYNVFSVQ